MFSEQEQPIRTFIYGSCVSRDTFEYLDRERYLLVEYVARQSLISAFARTQTDLPDVLLESTFQRRMVEGDWNSNLIPLLRRRAQETDLLLWDLVDERLGVWRVPDGTVVTRSVEGLSSRVYGHLPPGSTLLEFGTPQHLARWRVALSAWRSVLEDTGLLTKTVLLAPPWAEESSAGGRSPRSFGREAAQANRLVTPYLESIFQIVGCAIATLPTEDLRSDSQHRWGEAPFHYISRNYASLADRIDTLARRAP